MSTNNQNQFLQNMNNMMDPKNWGEFPNWNQFANQGNNFAAMDVNGVMNTIKRNTEALSKANQTAVEGVQAIMRRSAEVAQKNATEVFNSMKDLGANNTPEQVIEKQQNLMKKAVETSLKNTREVAEMATKSSMEIYDICSKRLAESVCEMNTVTGQKKKAS
jgi:phasin family protein